MRLQIYPLKIICKVLVENVVFDTSGKSWRSTGPHFTIDKRYVTIKEVDEWREAELLKKLRLRLASENLNLQEQKIRTEREKKLRV